MAETSDDEERRIRERIRKLRELKELRVAILWDDERALWLGAIDWSPFAGRLSEGMVAVEAPTVKQVLEQIASKID